MENENFKSAQQKYDAKVPKGNELCPEEWIILSDAEKLANIDKSPETLEREAEMIYALVHVGFSATQQRDAVRQYKISLFRDIEKIIAAMD